jgi:hypothetical protein
MLLSYLKISEVIDSDRPKLGLGLSLDLGLSLSLGLGLNLDLGLSGFIISETFRFA